MLIAPLDVVADQAGLGLLVWVVGAGEAEVAKPVELRLDPVGPGGVVGRVGELDVVVGLWGALTRFRFGEACGDRRVVRPYPESEELVLVLVALLPGVPLPAPARLAASSLAALQGARDRRTSTRTR